MPCFTWKMKYLQERMIRNMTRTLSMDQTLCPSAIPSLIPLHKGERYSLSKMRRPGHKEPQSLVPRPHSKKGRVLDFRMLLPGAQIPLSMENSTVCCRHKPGSLSIPAQLTCKSALHSLAVACCGRHGHLCSTRTVVRSSFVLHRATSMCMADGG